MTTLETKAIGAPPIWVSVSETHLGIVEISGAQSSAVILGWPRLLGVEKIYKNDDVAWCALWMNVVLRGCQLPTIDNSRDPYDMLRALKFAAYGQPLPVDAFGMIGVFTRPEGAHVGIVLGHHGLNYWVRGGNQKNSVREDWIPKARLVARRWPAGLPLPSDNLPLLAGNGQAVSHNEA